MLLLLDLLTLTSKANIYHYNRTGRKNIDRKTRFQMKEEADQQLKLRRRAEATCCGSCLLFMVWMQMLQQKEGPKCFP